jgi:hypothetical protein
MAIRSRLYGATSSMSTIKVSGKTLLEVVPNVVPSPVIFAQMALAGRYI